jgi:hypothetical protein
LYKDANLNNNTRVYIMDKHTPADAINPVILIELQSMLSLLSLT